MVGLAGVQIYENEIVWHYSASNFKIVRIPYNKLNNFNYYILYLIFSENTLSYLKPYYMHEQ